MVVKQPKYIIITGGVLSGLGKGITAASIGTILKALGLRVTAIKIDPYLNCDAGTMNPYQHGEVFVLEDGSEVDLDLGHYERFLDVNLSAEHNITTGKVYKAVIEKERRGDYLGHTVQIIPHITNEIKSQIKAVAKKDIDIVLIELGGTVGDIESMPFLEAVRQLHREVGGEPNCIFVHTTLVPVIGVVGEQKTKPTQHSVKELRAIGIQPDIIIGRSDKTLQYDIKRKISLFCDVPLEAVISVPDVKSIYEVPRVLESQNLTNHFIKLYGIQKQNADLDAWNDFINRLNSPKDEITVALVGKYTHLKDSYISYIEALNHCSAELLLKINIKWIEATDDKIDDIINELKKVDGIIVPGGFGKRGTEAKIAAINYARTNKIPFLGVCLGFQLAVVEFCRNKLNLENANSTEFEPNTEHPVIDLLPEQIGIKNMGATMRLGSQEIELQKNSIVYNLYKKSKIYERHRHRYEVNPKYIDVLQNAGLKFTGISKNRMEIAEISEEEHPYFVATQFHPEFKSRPHKPAVVYLGLCKASYKHHMQHSK
jgi:CTP synthase